MNNINLKNIFGNNNSYVIEANDAFIDITNLNVL
jgi:hypothetical protein